MSHEAFVYDTEKDVYRCPAGQLLTPSEGRKINTGGRIEIRYTSRKADCDGCPLRSRCLSAKTPTRTVYRWEHEAVLERHRARMKDADAQMRRRSALAEHPFGTLKCRAGYRHFLVRGLNTVRGEWSLMALCYNFSRVFNLVGLKELIAYFVKRAETSSFFGLSCVLKVAMGRTRTLLAHFWAAIIQNQPPAAFAPT
jgi:Transposase DDE domain